MPRTCRILPAALCCGAWKEGGPRKVTCSTTSRRQFLVVVTAPTAAILTRQGQGKGRGRKARHAGDKARKARSVLGRALPKTPAGQARMGQVLPTGFEPVSEAREASILGH